MVEHADAAHEVKPSSQSLSYFFHAWRRRRPLSAASVVAAPATAIAGRMVACLGLRQSREVRNQALPLPSPSST